MRTLLLIGFLMSAVPALAQPTLSIWVDSNGTLVNVFDVVPGEVFEIVITIDTDGRDIAGAAWTMPAISEIGQLVDVEFPQSFLQCNGGACSYENELYDTPFDICKTPAVGLELLRLHVVSEQSFSDFVFQFRDPQAVGWWLGMTPRMGDCSLNALDLVLGGSPGGTTASGVEYPDGALILNPSRAVPNRTASFGLVKWWFQAAERRERQ